MGAHTTGELCSAKYDRISWTGDGAEVAEDGGESTPPHIQWKHLKYTSLRPLLRLGAKLNEKEMRSRLTSLRPLHDVFSVCVCGGVSVLYFPISSIEYTQNYLGHRFVPLKTNHPNT